jgi:hypothetical protein
MGVPNVVHIGMRSSLARMSAYESDETSTPKEEKDV